MTVCKECGSNCTPLKERPSISECDHCGHTNDTVLSQATQNELRSNSIMRKLREVEMDEDFDDYHPDPYDWS